MGGRALPREHDRLCGLASQRCRMCSDAERMWRHGTGSIASQSRPCRLAELRAATPGSNPAVVSDDRFRQPTNASRLEPTARRQPTPFASCSE